MFDPTVRQYILEVHSVRVVLFLACFLTLNEIEAMKQIFIWPVLFSTFFFSLHDNR